MNINNEVKYAKLHTAIFIPGLGNVKDTLSKDTIKNLEMYLFDNVLALSATSVKTGAKVSAAVPLANVQNMVFASDWEKPKV